MRPCWVTFWGDGRSVSGRGCERKAKAVSWALYGDGTMDRAPDQDLAALRGARARTRYGSALLLEMKPHDRCEMMISCVQCRPATTLPG